MNTLSKKVVIIGNNESSSSIIDVLVTLGVEQDEILVIGPKKTEDPSSQIQSSLYILQLIVENNVIKGLIVVDKIIGEIFLIQSSTVFISDLTYSKLFEEIRDIRDLHYDLILLLQEAGVAISEFSLNEKLLTISTLPARMYEVSKFLDNRIQSIDFTGNESTTDFNNFYKDFLASIRVLPDLEKLTALQKQVNHIIQSYSNKTAEELEKGHHLIDVIRDGLNRFALEEYSEKTNIYELIWTNELKGSLLAAAIVMKN